MRAGRRRSPGVILVLILLLVAAGAGRARRRAVPPAGAAARARSSCRRCAGRGRWLATALCLLPFAGGFVLPVGVMLAHRAAQPRGLAGARPGRRRWSTRWSSAGLAALLTVGAALFLVYGAAHVAVAALARWLLPLTTLGYAAPGAVLAVGLLMPLAALDHRLADAVLALTGLGPRAADHRHGRCAGAGLFGALLRHRAGRGRCGLRPGVAVACRWPHGRWGAAQAARCRRSTCR